MKLVRTSLLLVTLSIGLVALGATELRAEPRQPLSSAQIRQVMSQHAADVRACYVEHAMSQDEPSGTLTLELLVRAGGQVAAVQVAAPSVQDKEQSKNLERCVVKLSKGWRFPKSSYQTLVKYPMMFLHTQAQGAGPVVPEKKAANPS